MEAGSTLLPWKDFNLIHLSIFGQIVLLFIYYNTSTDQSVRDLLSVYLNSWFGNNFLVCCEELQL